MLVKSSEVIGSKVITIQGGKNIENVDDIIYDPEDNQVRALVVNSGGLFSDAQVIMMEDVKSIGQDAIMVESDQVLKSVDKIPPTISEIVKNDIHLTHKDVVTEDGTDLGSISDIIFDSNSGKVEEFEVSQGRLENIRSGKKTISIDKIVTVGEDDIIVSGYTEQEVRKQAQSGGLQGTINQAMDTLEQETPKLSAKTKQVFQRLIDQVQGQAKKISEDEYLQQKTEEVKFKAQQTAQSLKQQAPKVKRKLKTSAKKIRRAIK